MDNKEKSPEQELIESIGLMIEKGMESNTNIYTGVVKSVDGKRAVVTVNGQNQNVSIATADVSSGNVVRVFVPKGNMSAAFIIKAEASGGGGTTTTAYGDLTGKPQINGVTLVDNKTSKELNLYGTGNVPPYPVTSVNGQTGDVTIEVGGNVDSVNGKTGVVVLTQDDVGDGTTYVRTHNDFTDALKTQINTNKDNIAVLDGDVEGLQTDVGTLKTNVTSLQTALTSKQDAIVGAASTITKKNLTKNRALVSNSSGKVAVSTVTSTELGYLDGVTSNVQTQLDKKLEKAPVTSVNSKTGAVQLNASDVGALPNTTVIPSKTSQLDNDSGFITDIPIASATQLGGVKIGAGLSVTENGVLSATGGGTADAVEWNNVLDKPTTIAGYGITDAKIENGTITLGNKTITPLTSAPVTSVNSKTGAVVLGASDVGAISTGNISQILGVSKTKVPSEKAVSDALLSAGFGDMLKSTYDPTGSVATAGGIPDYVEANGGKIDTIKVNGTAQVISDKTVNITVPTKTSDLTNDSGYLTSAPVTSVNSKTGAVKLAASDVGAVSKAGDTMTGNLTVGSASLQTNGYVTGTWLRTTANTALSSAASKIAVINDGWVYTRTAAQIKSDIGLGNVDNVKLPTVTTTDNGKFLRVVNGAWAAVAIADANGVKF